MEIILSACMIVRDEENNLKRCLDSIHELVDEIIVVDTGSVDATMDIAKSYERVKLFEQPWINDFSHHRNYSISLAQGSWFLIIDADEELAPMEATPEEFKEKLSWIREPANALIVNCVEKKQNGEKVFEWDSYRFFRNNVGMHYHAHIHNRPRFPGHGGMTDIVLYHYGYHLPKEAMERKEKRAISMLDEGLSSNPDDYRLLYYKGKALLLADKYEEGVECLTRAIEILDKTISSPRELDYFGNIYVMCANTLMKLNRPDDAYAWLKKGTEILPDYIDIWHSMACLAFSCMRDDLLRESAERYYELLPQYTESMEFSKQFGVGVMKRNPSSRGVLTTNDHCQQLMKSWLNLAGVEL